MKKLLLLISLLIMLTSLNISAQETESTPDGADLCSDPKTPKAEINAESTKEGTKESSVDGNK